MEPSVGSTPSRQSRPRILRLRLRQLLMLKTHRTETALPAHLPHGSLPPKRADAGPTAS